uniref:ZP domain-containing protein n=1 Tax=Meloidogyne hapla TaxID=6305 RepID=A0A1I8BKL7_MELHA
MSSFKTVLMLFATFFVFIHFVGLLSFVKSIEVGRGKHKLEGDNIILADGSRIADKKELGNKIHSNESCGLEIDNENNIVLHFWQFNSCTVDLIVEGADTVKTFQSSIHNAEFTMNIYFETSLFDCLKDCSSDFDLINENM